MMIPAGSAPCDPRRGLALLLLCRTKPEKKINKCIVQFIIFFVEKKYVIDTCIFFAVFFQELTLVGWNQILLTLQSYTSQSCKLKICKIIEKLRIVFKTN